MSRPTPAEARTRIVELLGDSVLHALGLKESLQNERKALESQDAEALTQAVTVKSDCVARLAALDDARRSFCTDAGFEAGPDQMQELIGWCDEDAAAANCWTQLMQIAAECNALNLTNGAIIRTRNTMLDANLAVLRGAEAGTDTYGRHGKDAAAMNRRSIAEA